MTGPYYQTLVQRCKREGKLTEARFFAGGDTPAGVLDLARNLFRDAAEANDDAASQLCLEYLIHAVKDTIFRPFIDGLGTVRDEHIAAYQAARQEVSRAVAQEMLLAWPNIPVLIRGTGVTSQDPVTPKTRAKVLEIVAKEWATVQSPAESMPYFDLLLQASRHGQPAYQELAVQALRQASDGSVSLFKIWAAHHEATSSRQRQWEADPLANVLAIAWARNRRTEDAVRDFRMLGPLLEASAGARHLAASTVAQISELDAKVRPLAAKVYAEVNAAIPVEPQYRSLREISITVFFRRVIWSQLEAERDQTYHDQFEQAVTVIREWQLTYDLPVTLKAGVMRGDSQKDLLWNREQRYLPRSS